MWTEQLLVVCFAVCFALQTLRGKSGRNWIWCEEGLASERRGTSLCDRFI